MVEMYCKQDEKTWMYTVAKGLEDTVEFNTIGHEFAIKDIYLKIGWKQKPGNRESSVEH